MAKIWKKHFSVDNAKLDSDHRELVGLVNSIEYAVNIRDGLALQNALKSTRERMNSHFTSEAQFAQALCIDFFDHNLAHRYILNELQHTIRQLESKPGTWPEHTMDYYPQFLMDWLIDHFLTYDAISLKAELQKFPYDYTPDLAGMPSSTDA